MPTPEELAAAAEAEDDKLFAEASAAANAKRGIEEGDADAGGSDDEDGEAGAPTAAKTKSTEAAPATSAAPSTETQPSATTQTPAAATQSDIWANATPEQQAAVRNYRSLEGRVPNLQRDNERLLRELDEARAQRSPAPSTEGKQPAAAETKPGKAKSIKDGDRLQQLAEDYPDFAPLIEGLTGLHEAVEETRGGVAGLAQRNHKQVVEENIAVVAKAIPEWIELTNQPEFTDWLGTRSKSFQDMATRNGKEIVDPQEALDVIGSFRTHLISQAKAAAPANGGGAPPTNIETRRKAQLEAARSPSTNRSPGVQAPTGSAESEDDALWNAVVAKVEKRKRA